MLGHTNNMLNDHEAILLNSKGYSIVDSMMDGVRQFNLIDNRTNLVVAHTPNISLMRNYLQTYNYI